jgi:hypothetical protein
MDRKLASILALLIVLIVIVPVAISAEISVGVKQGDWIEYQVTFTGTPAEEHNVYGQEWKYPLFREKASTLT